ncbi:ProQ/FinO family protein [Neisseriaceae bacterium JH1-16]|nr:ProQ/FinO family protein [Neisseriaceae bacterium JH1-16]
MSKETALGAALKAAVQTMSKKKQTDMIADHVYGKYEVFRRFRPLAIGIDQTLVAALPQFDPTLVARVLANHCRRPRYIKALAQGGKRFGLDGKPVGQVTPEEQEVARQNPALQPQAKPAATDAVASDAAEAAPVADATPASDAE